jgi:hypothetical protein
MSTYEEVIGFVSFILIHAVLQIFDDPHQPSLSKLDCHKNIK